MSSDSVKSVDYLVIGAGSGGIASARRASEFGVKPLIAEHGPLGGTCVSFVSSRLTCLFVCLFVCLLCCYLDLLWAFSTHSVG